MKGSSIRPGGGTAGRRAFVVGVAAACATAATRGFGQTTTPVQYRTAGELVADLAARRVSSVELLDQTIARIEALDKSINAVVVRDFDRARQAAIAADQALARGERAAAARPADDGEGVVQRRRPADDLGHPRLQGLAAARGCASRSQRLKAAGAVIIGKTNVPLALADWQSYNAIYGTTNNPWDLERTPGGSSGGSAAALAAGYVALELGSRHRRLAAHAGALLRRLRPQADLRHRADARPHTARDSRRCRRPATTWRWSGRWRAARSDLALAFDVIAGPDEQRDGVGWRLALPPPRHRALRDFRVLLIDTHPLLPHGRGDPHGARRGWPIASRKAGAKVARQSPLLPDLAEVTRNYMRLLGPIMTNGRPPEFYEQMRSLAATLGPDDQSLDAIYVRSANVGWREWEAANIVRTRLQHQWAMLFKEWDVVLCPTMPTPAFKHDRAEPSARRLDVDGQALPYNNNFVWAGSRHRRRAAGDRGADRAHGERAADRGADHRAPSRGPDADPVRAARWSRRSAASCRQGFRHCPILANQERSNAPCTPAQSRPQSRNSAARTIQRHHRCARRQSGLLDRHPG